MGKMCVKFTSCSNIKVFEQIMGKMCVIFFALCMKGDPFAYNKGK